ncbi:MAG TPA: response regulator, partial [Planctomycetota bacterium]|nr:response regulator [Planctomycetota bacterium]
MLQALIVEDDAVVRLTLAQAAEAEGFGVVSCESVAGARGALEKASFDIVLLDVKLPDGSGLDLLKSLQTRAATEVVLLTAHGSEQDSIEARQFGASTYLKKPVSESQLKAILANVARAHELKTEVENLRDELRNLGQFGDILGSSQVMQKLYDKITRVAPTDAT